MLQIKENKLKTRSGILIGEKVVVRIGFTTKFGVEDTDDNTKVLSWLQYKAFIKSNFDEMGLKSPSFTIADIAVEIIKPILKTENYGWREFNQIFKEYMINSIEGLESDDIIIVNM